MDLEHKRSLILLGHAHSGKTSLSESMLFLCKNTTRKGSVEEGNTVSDYGFDEIERKNSINLSALFCDYQGTRIQIVDTPGYADFFGEVLAGIRAVDAGIVVVDVTSAVEVGTEKAWELLDEEGLPRIIFINKTDKEGANVEQVINDIKERLSRQAVRADKLDDPALIEAVAESDDALLEKYLEGKPLLPAEISSCLRKAVASRRLFPILCGSAATDQGIAGLLDAILNFLPSPAQRRIKYRPAPEAEEFKELECANGSAFSALVFKNIADPYVGQLTVLRIFTGELASNTAFFNAKKKIKERIGQIYLLQGKEQRPVDSASAGDIVAIAKLKETGVCDSLCTDKEQFIFADIIFPAPAISASVKPKSREDEERISSALHKLAAEDPTFKVNHDPQTKELIISGLGDLHLDVMIKRMKKRFNVNVDLGTPKVSYKETISKSVKMQGKFKRQSGGRGQYGDVWIEIQPLERGAGFEFVDKIFGGAIPKNYIPSVEKGVLQACSEGAIAGYPIVDLRVILVDGSYHEVDSSDMAFQISGAMALRRAVSEAGPLLLEPIMNVEVTIPEDCLGGISGDINSRRGRIMGMDIKGKMQVVKAQVPLAEMFKYANDLRSITGGRGQYAMSFSHYEPVPHKISAGIISQYQAAKKQEE